MTIFVKVHMTLCNYSDAGSIIEKESKQDDQKDVKKIIHTGIPYELLTPAEIEIRDYDYLLMASIKMAFIIVIRDQIKYQMPLFTKSYF